MNITRILVLLVLILPIHLIGQSIDLDLTEISNQKPLDVSGSLWMQTGFYDVSGIPARTNNFIWSMGAQLNANLYGVSLPFAFTIGQFGNQFSRPVFGQIGVSPRYKWATGHIGHRNMFFSPYTLAGHTFLGGGIELNPGKFRFAAMAGKFRSATTDQPNLVSILPTYQRWGYGMKVGVGSANNFVDLIVFRGKDDPITLPDSVNLVAPAENMVVGLSSRFQLAGPLSFYLDIAGSAYTRDQRSRVFEGDSLSIDNYIPENLFTPRYSSRINFAGKAGLRYSLSKFQLALEYERIDPEYESMGAFFFMNDLENISVVPAFMLWEGRVNLQGSIGIQRNNLLGNRGESTRRFISNSALNYANPGSPFGFSASYSNFSINQTNGQLELSDTIRLTMVTNNLNVSPYWTWSDSILARSVVFSANYQSLNDRNPFTREFTDMNTLFFTGMYNWTRLGNGLGLSLGANYNQIEVFSLDTRRYGGTAGVQKGFGGGKGNASIQGTYNLTTINESADGSNWTINVNAGWSIAHQWYLTIFTNVLANRSKQFEDYTEYMGGARVQWMFTPAKKAY